jgi:hypothetical protein
MVLQNKQKVSSQWQYKKIIQKLEDFLESKLLQNIPTGNDEKKIEKKIIYTEIRNYLEKLKEEKNDRYN